MKSLKQTIGFAAVAGSLILGIACNYRAAPEPNASRTEQEAADVKTPSGGGTQTTDVHSVPERPLAAENTQMGSAVPPAAADKTRPHPQQESEQQADVQKPTRPQR